MAPHISAGVLSEGISVVRESIAGSIIDTEKVYAKVEKSQFKAYRPLLFETLRAKAGVTEDEFVKSLSPECLNCLSSDSKSGQAFWRTLDQTIVVKTIKHYEVKTFVRLMDSYALHVLMGVSMIGNILGLYRVRTTGKTFYFLVAKNVYPPESVALEKYDLKGSTVGRVAGPSSSVMKDVNLLRSGSTLGLGPGRAFALGAVERDSHFLSKFGLMDYSLLVAKERQRMYAAWRFGDADRPFRSTSAADAGKLVLSGHDGYIYHLGIIDWLQRYTFRKLMETLLKSLYCDGKKISCVRPRMYAERMMDFIVGLTT
jgi:hypothetical protein